MPRPRDRIVEMGTVEDLEIILDRFKRAPLNVARSELEMFRRALEQDPVLFAVIEKIIQTEQQVLGAKAATLAKAPVGFGIRLYTDVAEKRYQWLLLGR